MLGILGLKIDIIVSTNQDSAVATRPNLVPIIASNCIKSRTPNTY